MDVASIRLTELSSCAGCAAKLGAAELQQRDGTRFARNRRPACLVGYGGSDDAGVYLVRDDLALVQTVDFFTPIVDDPYDFGRIAATNALSDVYAMGGRPLTALNIVAFPEDLDLAIFARILEGGATRRAQRRRRDLRRSHDQGRGAEVRHGRHRRSSIRSAS